MIYYTWSKGSLFSFLTSNSKTRQSKVKFICDIHTAFCKDQQFGKHYMRIRKMINFKMISSANLSAKLHFTLVSTFHSMRCFPGLPLFLLMKLNLSLTSEVSKHIIMRDLSFSECVNLMFVSLVGFYLNQAHFRI